MSNTSVEMKLKGSILRMQQVANNKNLTEYFSHLLGETEPVKFLSPLASEDFKEYKLNQMEEFTGITWGFGKEVWPDNQPQWDGIAKSADGKTLYLIEAKSHIDEMKTKCTASKDSYERIEKIVEEGSRFIPHDSIQDLTKWMNGYYQLANRLLFLAMLRQQTDKLIFNEVKLVLLNFVNDTSMPNLLTEEYEWQNHYEIILRQVFGTSNLELKKFGVDIVYLDVDSGVGGKSRKSEQELQDEFGKAISDLNTFYSKDIVNCRYVTEDFQWGTDYIAKLFLKGGYVRKFDDILAICRGAGKSYNLRETHKCESLDNDTNRLEEKIAMKMRLQGYIDGIGEILDYQVPLKDEQSDKAGKIDLLAYDKKEGILRILELKAPNNDNDSLLHCVLEGETYKRVLTNTKNVKNPKVFDGQFVYGIDKLKHDFRDVIGSVKKIVACSVIFESQNCRAYREYCNYSDFSNVYKLAQDFRQEVIVVKERESSIFERVK